MLEYKREKQTLSEQLKDLRRRAVYHDDHLRTINQWFRQLTNEITAIAGSSPDEAIDVSTLPSALLFANQETFEEHLQAFSDEIRTVIRTIFTKSRQFAPDVLELQKKLSLALAADKELIVKLERALAEKVELEASLEKASLRYMVAEKKLDKAKSTVAAKMEQQAQSTTRSSQEEGGPVKSEEKTNGGAVNGEEFAELESETNKLNAICEKQKEQIGKLEEDKSTLTTHLTEHAKKTSTLSDDDYAKTELFKQSKSQLEDLIKKINHLEALNTQFQEESARYKSERSSYKTQLENESQSAVSEKDIQLAQVEANLTRIRNARDELLADQQIKKASLDQDRRSLDQARELALAQAERISVLESERKRLTETSSEAADSSTESFEELQGRFTSLSQKYDLLSKELESMNLAYARTSKLANQKLDVNAALEEKVVRLSAEKAKADQKYFAAMKNKETRDGELRSLRLQNTKSSELFSQLKEAEAASRELISNFEKQLAESEIAIATKVAEQRSTQEQYNSRTFELNQLTAQVNDLKSLLTTKDTDMLSASSSCRTLEQDNESLRATLADTKKNLETWRQRGLQGSSEQANMLRVSFSYSLCLNHIKHMTSSTDLLIATRVLCRLSQRAQKHRAEDVRAHLLQCLC